MRLLFGSEDQASWISLRRHSSQVGINTCMKQFVSNFYQFITEAVHSYSDRFPHEIKSEKYWRTIVYGDNYLSGVLDTIMNKQGGRASDRQMAVLRRKERGDTSPYPTKN